VIGWNLDRTLTARLPLMALENALKDPPPPHAVRKTVMQRKIGWQYENRPRAIRSTLFKAGAEERLDLLRSVFPDIERHLQNATTVRRPDSLNRARHIG